MAASAGRRVEEERDREAETDLIECAAIAWRRRRLVLALALAAGSISLAHTLLQPNVYEASATIVTSQEGSAASRRDILVSILQSRALAEDVVERFHLRERLHAPLLTDAIRALQSQTDVSLAREGVIAVSVETTDPQLSADVANYQVSALERMAARFCMTAEGRRRRFIEERLKAAEEELSRAEETLIRFEEPSKTPGKGEIIASRVELEAMRGWAAEPIPAFTTMDSSGAAAPLVAARDEACDELGVPRCEVPDPSLAISRLARDVKAQETVYTLLTQQLELAKIAEAREMPPFQTLDRAVPAERKSGPNVARNVLLAAGAGGAAAVVLALLLDLVKRRAEARERRERAVIDLELDADGVHARPPDRIPGQPAARAGDAEVEPGRRRT